MSGYQDEGVKILQFAVENQITTEEVAPTAAGLVNLREVCSQLQFPPITAPYVLKEFLISQSETMGLQPLKFAKLVAAYASPHLSQQENDSLRDYIYKITYEHFPGVEKYREMYLEERSKTLVEEKSRLSKLLKIQRRLEEVPITIFSDFEVDGQSIEMKVPVEPQTLPEMFDSLIATRTVPIMYFEGEDLPPAYRVFYDAEIKEEWIGRVTDEGERSFGRHSATGNGGGSGGMSFLFEIEGEVYDGLIEYRSGSSEAIVKIAKIPPTDHSIITREIQKIFDGAETSAPVLTSITGTFTIDSYLNRSVFAHLLFTHPLFKKYLFTIESTRAMLQKDKFDVYCGLEHNYNTLTTTHLTFTTPEKINEKTKFRVSGAKNLEHILYTQTIIGKLWTLYLEEYSEVVKKYATYGIVLGPYKKNTSIKKKDQRRRTALEQILEECPSINQGPLKGVYTKKCGPSRQPRVIPYDDYAEEMIEQQRAVTFECDGETKVFVCDTPLNEKSNHIYAGTLVKGIPLEGGVPCCYKNPQSVATEREQKKPKEGYVIQLYTKVLQDGQKGILPPNISSIIEDRSKKAFGRKVRRYGIENRPDSFLRCMLRGLRVGFDTSNRDLEVQREREILKDAPDEVYHVSRQETVSYTIPELRQLIGDSESYIDPQLWLSIFEHHFNRNIYIFRVLPEEEPFIPTSPQPRLRGPDRGKNVVLLMYPSPSPDVYPYQFELVGNFDGKTAGFFDFSSVGIVKKIFERWECVYTLY